MDRTSIEPSALERGLKPKTLASPIIPEIDRQNLHGEYEEREAEQMKMNVGCESYLEE